MPGELDQQAIEVSMKGTKISFQVLKAIIQALNDRKNQLQHGEQRLEQLNRHGRKLESIDIPNTDIKELKQTLKRYSVDFSIMKEKGGSNYTVFFKGQDIDRVYKGLENYLKDLDFKKSKKPMKEVMKEAVDKSKEKNNSMDNRQKEKNMKVDRGERS